MTDFTRIPASIILTDNFPQLTGLPEGTSAPELPEETRRLSRIIDYLYTKTPEGEEKDHDCLINGWNGTYISSMPGWQGSLSTDEVVIDAGDARIQIPTYPVRVSDDFASADIHIRKRKSHAENPISAMGTYIITFVRDSRDRLSVLVDKRGNTPLYPGKWNGTGTAIPAEEKHDYIRAVTERTGRKYSLDLDPDRVHPLGILIDNAYNITLPSGFTVIDEAQARGTGLKQVPLLEFPGFIDDEAPIEEWNFPGFLGICMAIEQLGRHGYGAGKSYSLFGRMARSTEYKKLQQSPLEVQSALQIIEQDAIRNGRSLIEYFAHLVELPEQDL